MNRLVKRGGVDAELGVLAFENVENDWIVQGVEIVDSFGRIFMIFRLE